MITDHSDTIKYRMMHKAIQGYFTIDNHAYVGAPPVTDQSYYMDIYPEMGTLASSIAMFNCLYKFLQKDIFENKNPQAYFAVFDETEIQNEEHFNTLVWNQLHQMHQNLKKIESDEEDLSYDPNEPDYVLSIGDKTVNITGLHPQSSRRSHRFPWAVLVFSVSDSGYKPTMMNAPQ